MKKVFLDALGCPKALVDAERMAYFLGTSSFEFVSDAEEADVIIVNTCGFIEDAKQESVDTILQYAQLKQKKPSLEIVATGCLVERYKGELLSLVPEIDHAMGVKDPSLILQTLSEREMVDREEYHDTQWITERNLQFSGVGYAYLKVSEGCNRQCGFCVIPSIRGMQRSRSIEDILVEARFLHEQGIEELILIAEDTMSYGLDLYGERRLPLLLSELVKVGFTWIRVMYLYPEDDVFDVVRMMREYPQIVPYVDIPLQHASSFVLQRMRRGGSSEEFLRYIAGMREILPDISIRSTFVIGYPGETEEDVEVLARFLKDAELDRVGFFAYSDEEGSYAFSLDGKLSKREKKARIAYLASLQREVSRKRLGRFVGREVVCIDDGERVELRGKSYKLFRTPYDAPEIDGKVYVPLDEESGELFCRVKIEGVFQDYDLKGVVV